MPNLTTLQRENEDLKRQIESMRYDLDAMSAIKEERDECCVLLRECLRVIERHGYLNLQVAIKERLQ